MCCSVHTMWQLHISRILCHSCELSIIMTKKVFLPYLIQKKEEFLPLKFLGRSRQILGKIPSPFRVMLSGSR